MPGLLAHAPGVPAHLSLTGKWNQMGPKPPVASPSESRLRALLEGTVLPSPNTVEMLRTAPSDYRRRFDGGNLHVAELFQENTKLSPHTTLHDRGDAAALDHARAWYLSTAYRVEDDDLAAGQADTVRPQVDTLPPSLAGILAPFAQAGRLSSLLYGLDLLVLHEQWLLRVVPRAGFLWRDRRLAGDDERRIRESIVAAERVPRTGPLLFVAAAPWRYMMFLGPRGYRRMLLDAGELLGRLRDVAADAAVEAAVFPDFYDRRVDDALLLDGVERTVVAIVALEGGRS